MPVILACALLAPTEKFFKRVIPEVVRGVFAPMLSLFVTCIATILVVGPVANTLSDVIAQGLLAVLNFAPAIGGAAIAFAWPFLIIFGMHWGFIPVMMANFGTLGYDFIMPLTVGTNFAVGAVLLAIFFKTKKKDLKDTCIETLAPAWLAGVTEPGIYGVLLRFKRTFVIMALGCAVAGAIGGIAGVHQSVMLSASVLTLPALYGDMGIWQVVQALAATAVAFVLTFLFGYNDNMDEGTKAKVVADKPKAAPSQAKPEAVQAAADKNVVCAPVSGTVEQTDQIPDPAFASELMGKTVAVWPSNGNVYAPVAGTVVSMMPHAFGIAGDDGCEVLVHVGIDTVSMNGDGFTLWAQQGDHVSAGQPMLTFDRDKVAVAGYKDIVMTIVTNSDDYTGLSKSADGSVSAGEQIIRTA
ncbi:MAG: glucose PTS transporter subunit IIA [Atopobiaceae bacterium]|nr:glucose PTS transporter subunit IIA [Atopobiaceae bacterium]